MQTLIVSAGSGYYDHADIRRDLYILIIGYW